MKVGVYVDGYNLYYGGRGLCGSSTPGWRWLDIRALTNQFVGWSGAKISHIVYCTARVNDPDQDAYLEALVKNGSVDEIVEGRYDSWAKEKRLTGAAHGTKSPKEVISDGSQYWSGLPIRETHEKILLANVIVREEKGSDVNVATHLLHDVYQKDIDAAIVISNDSDLALPLQFAREELPVGLINPQKNYLAGTLRGSPNEGAGRHWWRQLSKQDFYENQLPGVVGSWRKPKGW